MVSGPPARLKARMSSKDMSDKLFPSQALSRRTSFTSVAPGAVFTVLLRVFDYFSSGLYVGRVLLAGALSTVGTFFLSRRRLKRRT
jgi:hypothetical protein